MSGTAQGWQIQFKDNVQHALQRDGSIFRAAMDVNTGYKGEGAQAVERVGPVEAQRINNRYGDTPIQIIDEVQRWIYPDDWETGTLILHEDKARKLGDPTNMYVQSMLKGMQRYEAEQLILPAFFGSARTGKQGINTTLFPAGNVVAATLQPDGSTGTATGLNLRKLQRAKRLLQAGFVDINAEEIYAILTSADEETLANDIAAVSTERKIGAKFDDKGNLVSAIGITFLRYEVTPMAGSERRVPVWCKSGMHYGIWADIKAEAQPDPGKRYNYRPYIHAHAGATRLDEAKVIDVRCV